MSSSTIDRARFLAGFQEKLDGLSKNYTGVERRAHSRVDGRRLPIDEVFTGVTPEEKDAISEVFEVDMVNAPPHYQIMPGVEVIDVRKALMDKIPSNVPFHQADDWSRSWEYITRMWGKNGLEDAKKARFYLNRLIDGMETGE